MRKLPDYPLRHVLVRHEQAAAQAADGYARATGRVGVCFAISAPGVTNLVTGLATALRWAARTRGPVLLERVVDPEANVFSMVPPGATLDQALEG